MKKRSKRKTEDVGDVDAEIKQISDEMAQMEYRSEIDDSVIQKAKSESMNLLLALERTVCSEEERAELEAKITIMWGEIEAVDKKLQEHQNRIAHNRVRLEKIKSVHEGRKARQR